MDLNKTMYILISWNLLKLIRKFLLNKELHNMYIVYYFILNLKLIV